MSTAVPYAGFLGANDPYRVMESTAERIAALASRLTPAQISASPRPGKWSIHQIVAHLADSELVANVRFRMLLFEASPVLVAYDQDLWMNGWMRESEAFEITLERFRMTRESTLRALRAASPEDMERQGTHTERGPVTAAQYLITIAGHDINHLKQIEGMWPSA